MYCCWIRLAQSTEQEKCYFCDDQNLLLWVVAYHDLGAPCPAHRRERSVWFTEESAVMTWLKKIRYLQPVISRVFTKMGSGQDCEQLSIGVYSIVPKAPECGSEHTLYAIAAKANHPAWLTTFPFRP